RGEAPPQGLSLGGVARGGGVSASMLSQVETERTRPSVSTIYAIATELGLSIDALLSGNEAEVAATSAANGRARRAASSAPALSELACQLVRPAERRKLELESGVTWELLSDLLPHLVDFMYVTYEPGGSRKIQVVFDEYTLGPGDARAFASSEPHLLVNEGSEPAEGIWFVLGRRLTPESHAARVVMPLDG